jgi:hypothetical protein
MPGDGHEPPRRLGDDVKRGLLGRGPPLPETADAAHDDPRVDFFQHRVIDPQSFHDPGGVILQDNVGGLDEVFEYLHRLRMLQV